MGKKSELEGSARRDVVLMLLRREEPAAVLGRRYGISEQTLYRWRDEFLAGGEAALGEFRQRYNGRRPHWALVPELGGDPLVPEEVYTGSMAIRIPKWQGWAKGAKEKLDRMLAGEAA